jgi:DnaK suppressor protein
MWAAFITRRSIGRCISPVPFYRDAAFWRMILHHIVNTAMNTAKFKQRLLAKQQELLERIATATSEGREARSGEVEDPADEATSSELTSTAFAVGTLETKTLEQVRAALRRIDDGTYGKCIDCGRPIEPARLEAVPWTPYCRADQEKHDSEAANAELS